MYKNFFKNLFDISLSIFFFIILSPIFFLICLIIFFIDGLPIFFFQKRVGKNFREFNLIKFRTMKITDDKTPLTGFKDSRVTKLGYYIRKFKIDEIPQIINVIKGDMSIVGPRPEIKKMLIYYDKKVTKIMLNYKPGITDYASIYFSNEEKFYENSKNIINIYKKKILPKKQKLILRYLSEISFYNDLKIIILTIKKIFIKINN